MGKVKQLWQDDRDARWQQHFDDYCHNEFGGREPSGREHDEATDYANSQMEEEDGADASHEAP
jgi:hypothetical protein